MHYFAYGSNLLEARLSARTPSARFVATGALPGYSLRFHKRGSDGSGKCDAFFTGRPEDEVLGALYHLDPTDINRLDRAEGPGYQAVKLEASTQAGPLPCFAYLTRAPFIDPAQRPFAWYHALVIAGAHQRRFPQTYIETIERMPTQADPDGERETHNRRLLKT